MPRYVDVIEPLVKGLKSQGYTEVLLGSDWRNFTMQKSLGEYTMTVVSGLSHASPSSDPGLLMRINIRLTGGSLRTEVKFIEHYQLSGEAEDDFRRSGIQCKGWEEEALRRAGVSNVH